MYRAKNYSRKKNRNVISQGHATHDGHHETYIELLPSVECRPKMRGGVRFKFSTKSRGGANNGNCTSHASNMYLESFANIY